MSNFGIFRRREMFLGGGTKTYKFSPALEPATWFFSSNSINTGIIIAGICVGLRSTVDIIVIGRGTEYWPL